MKFDIWLEEALAKDTWPVTRGYTKTADGEDFEPPIPVYIELSDYWEDVVKAFEEKRSAG